MSQENAVCTIPKTSGTQRCFPAGWLPPICGPRISKLLSRSETRSSQSKPFNLFLTKDPPSSYLQDFPEYLHCFLSRPPRSFESETTQHFRLRFLQQAIVVSRKPLFRSYLFPSAFVKVAHKLVHAYSRLQGRSAQERGTHRDHFTSILYHALCIEREN